MEGVVMGEGPLGQRFVPIRRDQLLFDGFDRCRRSEGCSCVRVA
jgi:hypothetical protein